ncbi:MAG: hypothetical protein AAGH76_14905, partial [Pseudomonadota bacterium]
VHASLKRNLAWVLGRMPTEFVKLNQNWNAEPNAPGVSITLTGSNLLLTFRPNPFQFPEYRNIDWITLTFHGCARYRLGSVNDEAWYAGRCRFSDTAPEWGQFFDVTGDLKLEGLDDWVAIAPICRETKHYLFYFRDKEFECDALRWSKRNAA